MWEVSKPMCGFTLYAMGRGNPYRIVHDWRIIANMYNVVHQLSIAINVRSSSLSLVYLLLSSFAYQIKRVKDADEVPMVCKYC